MPLTRAWAIILAFLATACLAGMFMLSSNSGGGFTEADRAAVRAITEAGVAALEAQLQASPVQQAASIARDTRIQEALETKPDPDDPDALDAIYYDAISEVAEETRVRTSSNMTVALVDADGAIMAANGAIEKELATLVSSTTFQEAPLDEDLLLSVTLADKLHVAKVLRPDAEGRRLVAVEPLQIGAGSLLRRVLGSSNPAGLIRKGELLGDIMGNQPVTKELIKLAKEHHSDTPNEGASKVFTVGEGMNARIGALGRIPGPAGQGDSGAMLVVLSTTTAAAGQQDMAQALANARDKNAELPWPLLGGLLVITMGLAFYLPGLEGLTPMRRLGREFNAIAQGTQHSIFHDRYGGTAGEVARAAAAAHEALRQAYLAELEIDEEEVDDSISSPRSRPRTARGRRVGSRTGRTEGSGARRSQEGSGVRRNPATQEGSGVRRNPATQEGSGVRRNPATQEGSGVRRNPATHEGSGVRRNPAASRARLATPPPVAAPPPAAPPPAAPPPPRAAPASFRPPSPSPATPPAPPSPPVAAASPAASDRESYYRGVYDEFLRVKAQCGEPTDKLSFEKFAQKLTKNTSDIMKKKPGVTDVQFTVYVKDGKAALKAKVVKG
ncbi:MAG: MXAN_5187 family protein [Myxococcota bacterium]